MDVGVEGPAVREVPVRPQQVDQLVTGAHPPRRGQQHGQQVELPSRQVGADPVHGDLPPYEVDGDRPEGGVGPGVVTGGSNRDGGGLPRAVGLVGPRLPPQDGVHAGHQLSEAERLGDVAGGAQLEAQHHIQFGVDRADHDDGHGGHLPHAPAHLDAPHPGQEDVEQDDVRGAFTEQAERLVSVRRHRDVEALPPEARGQGLPVGVLVLHHEDLDALVVGDHGV